MFNPVFVKQQARNIHRSFNIIYLCNYLVLSFGQCGWIYKFIQFNLIASEQKKKLFIPEIMKLRVKMRDKNSPKIE